MNTTKKYIFGAAAVAAIALSSCSGFLDTPTDTRVELVTTEQVQMLMNGAYPSANYAWPCEIMSDNIEDNNAPEGEGSQGVHYNLSAYDRGDDEMFRWEICRSNTDSDSPSSIWEGFYNSTAVANAVMEKLDQWREENGGLDRTQTAIYAEAQMLRAFNHFILAQVFCMPYGANNDNELGIPYITKPETTVKPHYERGTLAETYRKIEADMDSAMKYLNNGIYDVPKYHFNTQAANAFAARFYLYTRQYKKCIDACNKVFGGENADVTPYVSKIWSTLDTYSYISDFGRYQNNIDKQWNFLLYPTHSIELRRYSGKRRYSLIRDALNATVHSSSPVWDTFKWTSGSGKNKKSFTMHPCFNGICITNGGQEYGYAMCGNVAEQFEYTDKIAGIGYAHITRREFGGEEVLLTRAEARLFLGDIDGAIADLDAWEKPRRNCPGASGYEDKFNDFSRENIVRFYQTTDPGYGIAKPLNTDIVCPESDATASLDEIMPYLQCVLHMRRIETIHTGLRWFDIKRHGIEIDRKIGNSIAPDYHTMDRLTVNDPRRAIQIPAEVGSAGLQSNPRPTNEKTQSPSENVMVSAGQN
ncbi:MAG: RagB/SusD family nutrient uptake outer membrane protein [Bacteroidales bacterium]|nr:RagB/SusD family nutrient uptake outer membrane protein [Bacteroidales bacterium]